ncbi:hypothetical protein TWF594_000949 [Orbilia oligospora]|nr:hypothetical protein TWF706_005125 [Orbilia oligospora]KAF3148535.1 hypothetical protein TWF594_000949 [Orbilia oligospora]
MLTRYSYWPVLANLRPYSFSTRSLRVPQNTTFSTHICNLPRRGGLSTLRVYNFSSSAILSRDSAIAVEASETTSTASHHTPESPISSPQTIPTFQTGFSLYAKRAPRPFPKPWINPPTSSFSEPLSVHSTSLSRRPLHPHQHQLYTPASSTPNENAAAEASARTTRFLRGYTNGDDALLIHDKYLAVADGVGSWNMKEKGYPALWSRLLVHYFSIGCERFFNRGRRGRKNSSSPDQPQPPITASSPPNHDDPVDVRVILNNAFEAVVKATGHITPPKTPPQPEESPFGLVTGPTSKTQRFHGTTTFTGCLLHGGKLHVVSIGDSHCLVLRPSSTSTTADTSTTTSDTPSEGSSGGESETTSDPGFLLRTTEQWHYFDCPRQLGTDSPDTPLGNATVSTIDVENGDIVILATDGMLDNLWEEEVISIVLHTLTKTSSPGGENEPWGMELGQIMKKKGKKRVEEGVNVAFREYLAKNEDMLPGAGDPIEGGELMTGIAAELVKAAKVVATDPYAESPWMERAIEEGKIAEGGKLDDISVVVGRVVGV